MLLHLAGPDLQEIFTTLQYCAKVIEANYANFVLCSRELSSKVRSKVQAKFRGV